MSRVTQALRLTNLELLYKFGANANKAQINHILASAAMSDRCASPSRACAPTR